MRLRFARTASRPWPASCCLVAGAIAPATAADVSPVPSRVFGADRIATAVAAAASFSGGRADAVVLTRSDTFADALAGAPLASDKNGPLMLTSRTGLDPAVAASLSDVLGEGGTVYLLGNENALSRNVSDGVAALGYQVRRVAGADRFATAVEVAKLLPNAQDAALVTGWNFPDGLAAGALMGVQEKTTMHSLGVVLLTDGPAMPAVTRDYLGAQQFTSKGTVIAVGGAAVAASNGVAGIYPVQGSDRYDTAASVARLFTSKSFFTDGTTIVGVATGENWPDALAGSALLAYGGGPMVLTRPGELPGPSRDVLRDLQDDSRANGANVAKVLIFGDERAVSAPVAAAVADALR